MALEIRLTQKLSQGLVMTPQLRQAIKLLQLGRIEYQETIEQELLENPLLEEEKGDNITQHTAADEEVFQPEQQNLTEELLRRHEEQLAIDGERDDWSGQRRVINDDDSRPSVEQTLQNGEDLLAHLLLQLRTASQLTPRQLSAATHIVGNLDQNGFLSLTLEEIAEMAGVELEDAEQALAVVQSLDPSGIGARSLKECLLIQLDHLGKRESLSYRLLDKHQQLVEGRKFDQIARLESIAVEDVIRAVKMLRQLNPYPGRTIGSEPAEYITPDVYVRKRGKDYVVTLNENGVPKLRISEDYRQMLERDGALGKTYFQERLRQASWLLRSIEQRQQTILKVTESIVKFQDDFLEQGVQALRPLVLREVADDIGMHESTVSRITTGKYVHTPQGIFELKFFFTSGLKGVTGNVSSKSVQERIRSLITQEDSRRPLSDAALSQQLAKEGIDVARRTVAKYRELLRIPSSAERKNLHR